MRYTRHIRINIQIAQPHTAGIIVVCTPSANQIIFKYERYNFVFCAVHDIGGELFLNRFLFFFLKGLAWIAVFMGLIKCT